MEEIKNYLVAIITLQNFLEIGISFGLGIFANYIFHRKQMKNITILHDYEDPVDIGIGLTSLFPNVKLRYNGEYINYKIKYITGLIKNDDKHKAVTTSELPFELIFPDNCEVLEAKILESPNEEIQPKKMGNRVEISMPKTFMQQEKILYCILYKSPDIVDAEIKLKTRIANVDIITYISKSKSLMTEFEKWYIKNPARFRRMFRVFIASMLLIFLFGCLDLYEDRLDVYPILSVLIFITSLFLFAYVVYYTFIRGFE